MNGLFVLGLVQPLLGANPNLLTLLLQSSADQLGVVQPQPALNVLPATGVEILNQQVNPQVNPSPQVNPQVNPQQERINKEADMFINGDNGEESLVLMILATTVRG